VLFRNRTDVWPYSTNHELIKGTDPMDFASIGGIALALIGILAGMMIEGGSISQITQPTAAMIVVGGTMGAVMLQFPMSIFLAAMKSIVKVFMHKGPEGEAVLALIVELANKARKSGIVSLDGDLGKIEDPFLKQALMLAVDGTEPNEVRKIMQLELDNKSEIEEKIPAVFEAAGGYSPTVGIIGAVLGLIQVMKNLANIDEVGRGIATAFVATIYGVALANLIFLPAAGKLKFRHREEQMIKEMMLEGVISILEGMNPRMIETKLRTYLFDSKPESTAKAAGKGAEVAA
jgi:chemotaxis protein MotA